MKYHKDEWAWAQENKPSQIATIAILVLVWLAIVLGGPYLYHGVRDVQPMYQGQ